jgi:transcriptional regulator GlxA family with amidase domain
METPLDTLLVPGGSGVYAARGEAALCAWVRQRAGAARRVVSVCTGAFLLAEAGLLDGRRAV